MEPPAPRGHRYSSPLALFPKKLDVGNRVSLCVCLCFTHSNNFLSPSARRSIKLGGTINIPKPVNSFSVCGEKTTPLQYSPWGEGWGLSISLVRWRRTCTGRVSSTGHRPRGLVSSSAWEVAVGRERNSVCPSPMRQPRAFAFISTGVSLCLVMDVQEPDR